LDLAKHVFQVHRMDATEKVVFFLVAQVNSECVAVRQPPGRHRTRMQTGTAL